MMNGGITPLIKRGFFCNDSSIKYPFKKDTISVRMLMLIALVIPGIVIKFCDSYLRKLIKGGPTSAIKIRLQSDDFQEDGRRSFGMKNLEKIVNEEEVVATIHHQTDHEIERDNSEDYKEQKEATIGSEESVEGSDDAGENDCAEDKPMIPLGAADVSLQTRHRIVRATDKKPEEQDDNRFTGNFIAVPLNRDQNSGSSSKLSLKLRRTFGDFQLFLFGFCTTMLFTGIGKITCGRFRPHFMQRCQPDVDCSKSIDDTKYVMEFTCTNSQLTSKDMSYITTSWPSGHAAVMFYSMTYLIFYLAGVAFVMERVSRAKRPLASVLVFNSIYVLLIGLAGYIAATRVTDYHHHALDVFSGVLIGFSIALVLTRSIPIRSGLH